MNQVGLLGKFEQLGRITVSVEENALILLDGFSDDLVHVLAGVHLIAHMLQAIRHCRVDHGEREGNVLVPTHCSKLESVTTPGERRSAIAILEIRADVCYRSRNWNDPVFPPIPCEFAPLRNLLHVLFQ